MNSNFYWSDVNLFAFMGDAQGLLGSGKCKLFSQPLKSERDRTDLIAFMKEYSYEYSKHLKIEVVKQKGYDYYQSQIHSSV